MPIDQIHLLEGRSDEQKEARIEEVTSAIMKTLDAPQQSVRVILTEMPKQHFGIGGQSAKKLGR